jgi:transcription elongation GreA/GreB family factor
LINILGNNVDQDTAGKAIDILEHSSSIEDYRRDRWKNVVRMRFPEFKRKEEWVFSTKEATEKKRLELEHLIKVELPTNRKAVGEAAALGDLSENHEYKAARERQEYLLNRVQQLQNDLGRVRILQPGQTDPSEVRPGTRVTLHQNSQKIVVTILGPWDSNPKENIFSYQSPIGNNLLGKSPGDHVQWNDVSWTIEAIEPWTG